MEKSTIPQRISKVLHWIGELTARSGVAAVAALLVVVFGVVLALDGFPAHWEAGFSTAGTAITLLLLFVIQHTQNRQEVATQLKLDELIRTSPGADDLLVKIEKAKDEELIEREQDHIEHHDALRDGDEESGEK